MARYSDTISDQYGRPVSGVSVLVAASSSGATAVLTADDGDPLPNPLTAGDDGAYAFNAADAYYDLTFRKGGRTLLEAFRTAVGVPPELVATQGPQGPQGVPGAQGIPGPQGPAGPAGSGSSGGGQIAP